MATIEYRPVLICGPASSCARQLDDDVAREHDLGNRGGRARVDFPSEDAATRYAESMRSKVYGSGHWIRIDSRIATDWTDTTNAQDAFTIPLDEDSDVVDVYQLDANRTRLQISNADGDYFAADLHSPEILSTIEALAAHA